VVSTYGLKNQWVAKGSVKRGPVRGCAHGGGSGSCRVETVASLEFFHLHKFQLNRRYTPEDQHRHLQA
jgi:hypothetical protein